MDKDESVIINKDNHMYDGIRDAFTSTSKTIILGDGEGDAEMVKEMHPLLNPPSRGGLQFKNNIFRIGFFNMSPDELHYAERLTHFKTIYDVVLPAEASLDEVTEIIKAKIL